MARVVLLFVCILLSTVAPTATTDPVKTVVIVRAQGAGVDDETVIENLKANLHNEWPSRLRYYVEDVDPTRFSVEAYRRELPEYFRAKHGGRLDVLVVLSNPALEFVLSVRQTLFPDIPIVYAGTGWTADQLQQQGMTGVTVTAEPGRTVALALSFHPDTRNVALVGGSGRVDKESWQQAQQELQSLPQNVAVTSLTDLPFSEVIEHVGSLPPASIVLYTRVTRDATNAAFDAGEALQLIRSATAAPIYGCSRSYLGDGLVGGVLVDHAMIGSRLGVMVGRILAGETTAAIHPVAAEAVTAFDARELSEHGIDEARLPPDALVEFHEPTIWDRLPAWHFLFFGVLATALSAFAIAFTMQRRSRDRMQRGLAEAEIFEKSFADISTMFITVPSSEIDTAIRSALRRLVKQTRADCAVIYEAPDTSDLPWRAAYTGAGQDTGTLPEEWDLPRIPWLLARLRAGQVVPFISGERRNQLVDVAPGAAAPAAAILVPLSAGAAILGALWCTWSEPGTPQLQPSVLVDRFRLIGELLANVLQRAQMEARIEDTSELNAAIVSSLVLHVAVLDRNGVILSVNAAWLNFARSNDVAAESSVGPGVSYLDVVRRAAEEGAPLAQEAFDGIRDVCEGRRAVFSLEYECSSPAEERWFLMTVAALRRKRGGAVVTHRDITEAKRIERAIRESESRFRLLADTLPVGIWMADTDGRRTYFNRAWIEFTNHGLDEQLGDAWIYHLHPEDVQQYLNTCRSALVQREPFVTEYRIRRPDGSYGWFIEHAAPRYGPDGAFHGFIGSCLNVTRRKQAEDALRDVTGRVITAEEEERRRIARALHDGVAQLVALLAIDIDRLGQTPINAQATLATRMHALWERTTEISTELHRLSHALHPSRLEALGLVAALEGLCAEVTEQQNVRVALSCRDVPRAIPPDAALCIFRIVQEALRNVVKHSGAGEATVELCGGSAELSLHVSDPGRGFDTSVKHGGLGLVSMRERVRYAGGDLTIASKPGEGTRIEVRLPLRIGAAAAVAS